MRVRIRQQTTQRDGQTVDATPPRVDVHSGEFRGSFERGKEYGVTSLEARVLLGTGHFERVAPPEGQAEASDAEILAARAAEGADPATLDGALDSTTRPAAGTATAQHASITQTASDETAAVSQSPGDREALAAQAEAAAEESPPAAPDEGVSDGADARPARRR